MPSPKEVSRSTWPGRNLLTGHGYGEGCLGRGLPGERLPNWGPFRAPLLRVYIETPDFWKLPLASQSLKQRPLIRKPPALGA